MKISRFFKTILMIDFVTGLLIAIIEQIESQQGELNAQQIDFLKRCLEE